MTGCGWRPAPWTESGLTPVSALPALLETLEDKLTTGNLNLRCVVIPDDMADRLQPRRQVWSADYAGDTKEETERQLLQLITSLRAQLAVRAESRLSIYGDMVGNKILALFLGLYLGFTFLLAAAAVLALQQLSQAADNTGRYAILRRLGAEERQVKNPPPSRWPWPSSCPCFWRWSTPLWG